MGPHQDTSAVSTAPARLVLLALAGVLSCALGPRSLAGENEPVSQAQQRARKLVADLGADSYRLREQAQVELVKLGPAAIGPLEEALKSPDTEIGRRARIALAEIRKSARDRATKAMRKNLLWKIPTPEGIAGGPVLAEGAILYATWDNRLQAVDAHTGKELWRRTAEATSGLVVAERSVYLMDMARKLLAVDLRTGQLRHKFPSGAVYGTPAFSDGVIYVGGADRVFRALDARSGKEIWRAELSGKLVHRIAPVVVAKRVYLATVDGGVHAFNADTGEGQWSVVAKGQILDLVFHAGLVIARWDTGVRASDAATGKVVWDYLLPPAAGGLAALRIQINGKDVTGFMGPAVDQKVALAGGVLYLSAGDRLVALDAKTGKEMWAFQPDLKKQPEEGGAKTVVVRGGVQAQARVVVWNSGMARARAGRLSAPAVAGGAVYFGSREGLHALDLKSRQELWRFETPMAVAGRPVVANGVVYFATTKDVPFAFGGVRPAQQRQPRPPAEQPPGLYAVRLKAEH